MPLCITTPWVATRSCSPIAAVKKMADMRRFIIDKMPLIFSTPRYFDHIPLLAVALVTPVVLLYEP